MRTNMSKVINDLKNTWLKVIKTPGDADYKSAPKANVQVCVTLYGMNQLWAGDLIFNNYRDNFCTEFTGKKHGWIPVTGELVQRVMPYDKAENSKSVEWVPVSNEKRTSTLTDDT